MFLISPKRIRRVRQILSVLTAHGFGHLLQEGGVLHLLPWTRRKWIRKSLGERLREVFEELGPTFIKLGQLMSTRSDLLPREITEELKKLRDRAEPIPFDRIRPFIESELGSNIDTIFDSFDPVPEAAASIAQVHRARLRGGDEIVVKVQRPGIDKVVETDISIACSLAKALEERIEELRKYDISGIMEEMSRWLRKELDFSVEAGYIERFQELFKDDPSIKIPKIYKDLCTKKLLVMERICGKRLEDVTEGRSHIARKILELFMRQIFEIGLFHADPHHGNIFVLEDGSIAMVDFGQVGRIGLKLRESLARILISIVEMDPEGVAKECIRAGIARGRTDLRGLREDFADLFDRYYGRPLSEIEIGRYIGEVLSIPARRGLRMPMELILLMKALVIVGDIARDLDPDLVILDLIKPYARKVSGIKFLRKDMKRDLLRVVSETVGILREMPEDISEMISRLRHGTMRFEIEALGMEELISRIERVGNRISLGILSVGLFVGSTVLLASGFGPDLFGISALGLFGILIAGLMAFILVIALIRTGRI